MKELDQYRQVLKDTESSKPTLADYWARRGVISEALMGSAMLKRRIKDLWNDRKDHEKRDKIKRALYFLKELFPIKEASNLGDLIPGLFTTSMPARTDGSLQIYNKEVV